MPITSAFRPASGRAISSAMRWPPILVHERQSMCMTGDHQFLVRRDDPGGDPAVAPTDAWSAGLVGHLVQLEAEPGGIAADPGADRGGVLADPGGEHQRVEPAEGRSQRAQLAT